MFISRSFDAERDEHPVKFVLDNLNNSLIPAVVCWLETLLGEEFPKPEKYTIGAPWASNTILPGQLQAVSIFTCPQLLLSLPQDPKQAMEVPLFVMWYKQPSDGLPLLQSWLNTASDIFFGGYDTWREPMECKLRAPRKPGDALAVVTGGDKGQWKALCLVLWSALDFFASQQ